MRLWWLAPVSVLAGCASPADVEAGHARNLGTAQESLIRAQRAVDQEQANYEAAVQSAQEWNTHVLGIPASGWVAIFVVLSVLGFFLLVLLGLWAREAMDARRLNAARLAMEKEKTRQAELAVEKAQWNVVDPSRYTPPAPSSKAEKTS